MALPSAKFYTTGDVLIITTQEFGSVQAGAYSTGKTFRLYNDYNGSLGSDTATSVKLSVRGSCGGTDEIWVQQHWVQLKSDGCSSSGIVDDAQTIYTAVGKNKELSVGDIPSNKYRTIYARCYPPTDAAENPDVDFQLRVTYQQPATSICNWITGLRGNGVVASTGDPFAMSTGGSTGTIPYEAGYALIYNNEIYYGSSGTFDCSTGSSSTGHSIYLNESGAFGMTTGDVATNELLLYEATISSGVCTALTDKRVYLAGLQAGTTGAMPTTPSKTCDTFFDITNGIIYGAKTSTGWTALGATTFIGLTDTPASMSTGNANDFVVVNAGGTALEFSPTTGFALDGWGTPSTGTNLNATTGVHGLLPAGDADTTHYLAGDISWTSTTGIVLDSLATPTTGTALNSSTGRHGLLIALDGSTGNYLRGDGSWQTPTGATGGEANTASNAGTTGIGIYYQKSGVDLQFKAIHSTGNISVTDSTGTITVNLDVISTGIALDSLATPTTGTTLNATTGRHGLLLEFSGTTGEYLSATGGWNTPAGVGTFTGLTDTPADYIGDANKLLRVDPSSGAVEFVSTTGIATDTFGALTDITTNNATTGKHGFLLKLGGGATNYLRADGTWQPPPGATGGEANTASNVNTTGIGVYEGKVGVDLQFKGIRAGSSKATVTDTTGTHTISVDINSTGIALDSLGTPSTGTTLDSSTGRHGLLIALDGSTGNYLRGDGSWQAPPGATGGEANTASNAGTTGIGIYYQKSGIDLQFKAIHSTGNISVTDSTGTHTINLDVVSTGIPHNDLGALDTGDYQHMTQTEHDLITSTTGVGTDYLSATGGWTTPTDTNTFVGLTDTPADFADDANKLLRVNSSSGAVEFVSSTGLALDTFGTPTDITTNDATTGHHGLLLKLTGSTSTYLNADGSWSTPPDTGEVNTASNVNTTGVGVYEGKVSVDLQFKGIRAGSSKITVTDSTGTHTISADVNSTGILLDNLGTPEDNTDLNATTGLHGLLPKRDGNAAHWLDGAGLWTAPTASEVGALESSGAFTVNAIPQITSTGGVLKASVFAVTTGDVFDFGAHSAGFTEQAIATTTGTAAINWSNGIKALFTRSTGSAGAVTFGFTAPPKSVNLQLTIRGSVAGSTGTVTWPTVYWQDGTVPDLTGTASAIDVVSFYYSTGLTAYLGLGSANFSTV